MNSVNPRKVAELNIRLFQLQAKMLKDKDLNFFIKFENFIKAYEKSFYVGEIFHEQSVHFAGRYNVYNKFFSKDLLESSKEKRVHFEFQNLKLNDLILSRLTSQKEIIDTISSIPMTEEQFWAIVYLLVVEPQYAKEYLGRQLSIEGHHIFYVQLDDGKTYFIRVNLFVGWSFDAYPADNETAKWGEGIIFHYFVPIEN